MNDFNAGTISARDRLNGRWALGVSLVLAVSAFGSAAVLHRSSPADAADVVLGGIVFAVAIPLFAYAATARACRYGRLDDAVGSLARHGADRRWAATGLILGTGIRVAVVCAAVGAGAVLVAHGGISRAGLADAVSTAWIGGLGGIAYTTLFAFGSLLGRRGGGRLLAFLLDAGASASASISALPWPRAHLRSLIGGELVCELTERQSALVLASIALFFGAACLLRVRR